MPCRDIPLCKQACTFHAWHIIGLSELPYKKMVIILTRALTHFQVNSTMSMGISAAGLGPHYFYLHCCHA